ncbi:hypothetical protein J8273_1228 [Carpediemonas membranifera]|uniref:Uncharacterized protein n=1 Tax=Carpediemonas membranifera TaxID=201153 RepID=A0A8J6E4K8_9EUKA|nr:hypothetical protein J8273_1228 [Carpediemonas membranifera]|eukprot:KAG9397313.1 hypothetical protein J8273_1228 [Carpediemonas membranifera]
MDVDLDSKSVATACTRILFDRIDSKSSSSGTESLSQLSSTWRAYKQRLRALNSPQLSFSNYDSIGSHSAASSSNFADSRLRVSVLDREPQTANQKAAVPVEEQTDALPISISAINAATKFLESASQEQLSDVDYEKLVALVRLADVVNDRLHLDAGAGEEGGRGVSATRV